MGLLSYSNVHKPSQQVRVLSASVRTFGES